VSEPPADAGTVPGAEAADAPEAAEAADAADVAAGARLFLVLRIVSKVLATLVGVLLLMPAIMALVGAEESYERPRRLALVRALTLLLPLLLGVIALRVSGQIVFGLGGDWVAWVDVALLCEIAVLVGIVFGALPTLAEVQLRRTQSLGRALGVACALSVVFMLAWLGVRLQLVWLEGLAKGGSVEVALGGLTRILSSRTVDPEEWLLVGAGALWIGGYALVRGGWIVTGALWGSVAFYGFIAVTLTLSLGTVIANEIETWLAGRRGEGNRIPPERGAGGLIP
jgi:hypothetical protein